jgi:hypothetical protein
MSVAEVFQQEDLTLLFYLLLSKVDFNELEDL